jgi:hypothetical protein
MFFKYCAKKEKRQNGKNDRVGLPGPEGKTLKKIKK